MALQRTPILEAFLDNEANPSPCFSCSTQTHAKIEIGCYTSQKDAFGDDNGDRRSHSMWMCLLCMEAFSEKLTEFVES